MTTGLIEIHAPMAKKIRELFIMGEPLYIAIDTIKNSNEVYSSLSFLCLFTVWAGYNPKHIFFDLQNDRKFGEREIIFNMGMALHELNRTEEVLEEEKNTACARFYAFLQTKDNHDRRRKEATYDAECPACDGTGIYPDFSINSESQGRICVQCKGTGKIKGKVTEPTPPIPFEKRRKKSGITTVRLSTSRDDGGSVGLIVTYEKFLELNTEALFKEE